jgi:pimeloyl-ACP methyl ester carboxylesterase
MARLPARRSPEHIRVPTLIVHAVDDPPVAYENAEYAARHIPGSRLLALDGGHFMAGHHDQVRSELRQLLGSVFLA